jgi:hypothetical protein
MTENHEIIMTIKKFNNCIGLFQIMIPEYKRILARIESKTGIWPKTFQFITSNHRILNI